jgi:hypothetical protein
MSSGAKSSPTKDLAMNDKWRLLRRNRVQVSTNRRQLAMAIRFTHENQFGEDFIHTKVSIAANNEKMARTITMPPNCQLLLKSYALGRSTFIQFLMVTLLLVFLRR